MSAPDVAIIFYHFLLFGVGGVNNTTLHLYFMFEYIYTLSILHTHLYVGI